MLKTKWETGNVLEFKLSKYYYRYVYKWVKETKSPYNLIRIMTEENLYKLKLKVEHQDFVVKFYINYNFLNLCSNDRIIKLN